MPSLNNDDELIVEGIRTDGRPFRPSDWIERISTQLARYGSDHRLQYNENVHPCVINGAKCLCVRTSLKEQNPSAYEFILKFAADNQLRVQEDRRNTRETERRSFSPTDVPENRRTDHGDRRSTNH